MSGTTETGPQAHPPSLRRTPAAIWRRFVAALVKPEGRDALEERVFDTREHERGSAGSPQKRGCLDTTKWDRN